MKSKSNIKFQVNELEQKLKEWSKAYYLNDESQVTDQVYDANYNLLKELLDKHPELIETDSMIHQVGSNVKKFSSSKFAKVKHQFKMLSLDNAFNGDELIRFDKHIKEQLGAKAKIDYICELKIDGLSISLIYDQGNLQQAVTRGDGFSGEDVTLNVWEIKGIPKRINYQQRLEVRGEIFLTHQAFQNLNNTSDQVFANPRNAASGTLRQLDSQVVKERNLSAFIYMIPNPLDYQLKTQSAVLDFLKSLNFPVNPHYQVFSGIELVIKTLNHYLKLKDTIGFDIDGVVIKVNNLSWYDDIGFTSKYPKAMIAFKFPEAEVTTKLLEIFPTIGRTGKVTYNARLEPVLLNGSKITFATLHNADYIQELEINTGDEVKLKKSGEIIPRIIGLDKKHNKALWTPSLKCPSCQQMLVKLPNEVDQYCINLVCPARVIANFVHFCSKQAMNIVGLSEQTLKVLLQHKLISDFPSLYELKNHQDTILNLERFSLKSTNNLLNAIEHSKTTTLDRFIYALGIRHIGQKIATLLAKRFKNLDELIKASSGQISEILTLGPSVTNALITFFQNSANLQMIQHVLSLGLNLQPLAIVNSNKLGSLTFVLTGQLSKPRSYFSDLIIANGGNFSNTVSKSTDYVVKGFEAGSKLTKALNLGIRVITEEELVKMFG